MCRRGQCPLEQWGPRVWTSGLHQHLSGGELSVHMALGKSRSKPLQVTCAHAHLPHVNCHYLTLFRGCLREFHSGTTRQHSWQASQGSSTDTLTYEIALFLMKMHYILNAVNAFRIQWHKWLVNINTCLEIWAHPDLQGWPAWSEDTVVQGQQNAEQLQNITHKW